MKNKINMFNLISIIGLAVILSRCKPAKQDEFKFMDAVPVNFAAIQIEDDFWAPRLAIHADATLNACITQCRDETSRIRNFKRAAGLENGKHEGIFFDDSDVYKAMEGMACSLVNNPNSRIESILDEWIDIIAAAQQSDGYLNTYFTLNEPENRWSDMEKHEMYCGGHMIEAAIAFYKATGKEKFLRVAVKFADHLDTQFGPGKRHWVPGHEEIELALIKLYHVTREKRYLNLASWLLEERGHGYGTGKTWNPRYCQDDVPVKKISKIAGHAVRAMYLFTGMSEVASVTGSMIYKTALERVWDNVVNHNMYITGGIGSSKDNEGFTRDDDLPNLEAYCETCASVGMVFWNHQMNLLTGESKYADVLERSLYNGALAGISLSGDRFFYVNPLESLGDHHRQAWFGCACCPSQISRFLPAIGNYIYIVSGRDIFVNLFIGGIANVETDVCPVALEQNTHYPWDGAVTLTVSPREESKFGIHIRIPAWCKSYKIKINDKEMTGTTGEHGYMILERLWQRGDRIQIDFSMPVEMIAAPAGVAADAGKRAIQRGPLVYCAEETDNTGTYESLLLSCDSRFEISENNSLMNGLKTITVHSGSQRFTMIPYFAWDNRNPGRMKVWIDYH